jgi:DNA repair protein RadC
MKIKGIGEAKAITISAALELGRRRQAISSLEKPIVKDNREIANYLQAILRDHQHEVFAVVFLNRANKSITLKSSAAEVLPARLPTRE